VKELPLILASASPRRLELLRQVGMDVRPHATGIPEEVREGESPQDAVLRLAEAKARRAASDRTTQGVIMGADTVVVLDRVVLGKPVDRKDALRMLGLLAGRIHEVLTGLYILRTDNGRSAGAVHSTRVRFRPYDEGLVRWYVETEEPLDKAGAYGIQDRGALLVDAIEGSWSNVVGLPLERLPSLMAELGLDFLDYVRRG